MLKNVSTSSLNGKSPAKTTSSQEVSFKAAKEVKSDALKRQIETVEKERLSNTIETKQKSQ